MTSRDCVSEKVARLHFSIPALSMPFAARLGFGRIHPYRLFRPDFSELTTFLLAMTTSKGRE